jgi:tryptophan halogenase
MHRLPNYTEKTIENYNKDVNDIMTNIRDFVILHYITNKTNTQFWKDVSQIELPDSLKENLEKWRTNLPIADDFNSQTAYVLFRDAHYLQVLAGLDLFDREKIKQEYDMMHHDIKNIAENFIRETRTLEKMNPTVGHKEFISSIRNKKLI